MSNQRRHPEPAIGHCHSERSEEIPVFRFCCCSFLLSSPRHPRAPSSPPANPSTRSPSSSSPSLPSASTARPAISPRRTSSRSTSSPRPPRATSRPTSSPPTLPPACRPCATTSSAFPAKKTASSSWPATTRPTTRSRTSPSWAPTTGPAPPRCSSRSASTSARTHPRATPSGWSSTTAKRPSAPGTTSARLYGTRISPPSGSPTAPPSRIKALLVADMIGDRDLNILEETQLHPLAPRPPPPGRRRHPPLRQRLQDPGIARRTTTCPSSARHSLARRHRRRLRPAHRLHSRRLPPHRPGHHRQDQPAVPANLRRPLPRIHPPHQPALTRRPRFIDWHAIASIRAPHAPISLLDRLPPRPPAPACHRADLRSPPVRLGRYSAPHRPRRHPLWIAAALAFAVFLHHAWPRRLHPVPRRLRARRVALHRQPLRLPSPLPPLPDRPRPPAQSPLLGSRRRHPHARPLHRRRHHPARPLRADHLRLRRHPARRRHPPALPRRAQPSPPTAPLDRLAHTPPPRQPAPGPLPRPRKRPPHRDHPAARPHRHRARRHRLRARLHPRRALHHAPPLPRLHLQHHGRHGPALALFPLIGALTRLRFLHYGLAAVLAFAALKMLASRWIEIGPLAPDVILALLAITLAASLCAPRATTR